MGVRQLFFVSQFPNENFGPCVHKLIQVNNQQIEFVFQPPLVGAAFSCVHSVHINWLAFRCVGSWHIYCRLPKQTFIVQTYERWVFTRFSMPAITRWCMEPMVIHWTHTHTHRTDVYFSAEINCWFLYVVDSLKSNQVAFAYSVFCISARENIESNKHKCKQRDGTYSYVRPRIEWCEEGIRAQS